MVPETDREQFELERTTSFVERALEPELYQRCVLVKYGGDPQKLDLWGRFSGGTVPQPDGGRYA